MIAIIDYGVGNLFSLCSSFKSIGYDAVISDDAETILNADKIILPGVGAFEDAAKKLHLSGMDKTVKKAASLGKPVMGICLGMQLLFDKSFEYGEHDGLHMIPGNVIPLKGYIKDGLMIPHIGWNALHFRKDDPLFKYIKEGDYVYFVHSYYAADCDEHTVADTDYGGTVTAIVRKDNVVGCQFHPEKSGEVGLNILRAFCEK